MICIKEELRGGCPNAPPTPHSMRSRTAPERALSSKRHLRDRLRTAWELTWAVRSSGQGPCVDLLKVTLALLSFVFTCFTCVYLLERERKLQNWENRLSKEQYLPRFRVGNSRFRKGRQAGQLGPLVWDTED